MVVVRTVAELDTDGGDRVEGAEMSSQGNFVPGLQADPDTPLGTNTAVQLHHPVEGEGCSPVVPDNPHDRIYPAQKDENDHPRNPDRTVLAANPANRSLGTIVDVCVSVPVLVCYLDLVA